MRAARLERAPLPPTDLADRTPVELRLPAGCRLHRFFSRAYDPIHFGRAGTGRLDAPDGSYGVLYAALEPRGAFAKTFLRVPGRTLLATDLLARRAYSILELTTSLRLVRLAGHGLARVGATAQVTHGGLPYDVSQAWSAALRAHPERFDGIAYHARHDDEAMCCALFDTAAPAIREVSRMLELDQDWFWEIAEPYGVGLAP